MASRLPTFAPFRSHARQIRTNSKQRGYDHRWNELRNRFIVINPLCRMCEQEGRVEPATEVDHIIPFIGLEDPLRVQWENLQSLCHSCHVKKTWKDRKGE